jgi:hypothetical protein
MLVFKRRSKLDLLIDHYCRRISLNIACVSIASSYVEQEIIGNAFMNDEYMFDEFMSPLSRSSKSIYPTLLDTWS